MTPSSALTLAAAAFTWAIATTCCASRVLPLIGKFSTARWVWASIAHPAGLGLRPCCRVRCGSRPWRQTYRVSRRSGSAVREVQPVLLVAPLQPHVEGDRGGVPERLGDRVLQVRGRGR